MKITPRLQTSGVAQFLLAAFLVAGGSAQTSAQQSQFSSDAEGWTGSNASVVWVSIGGNPGGYIEAGDGAGLSEIVAPTAFTGDLSAFLGGSIRFDIRQIEPSFDPAEMENSLELVTITGPAGTARAAFVGDLSDAWQTIEVPLTPAGFVSGGGNLAAILANVTELRISADFFGTDSSELWGYDNIALVPGPSAISILSIAGVGFTMRRRRSDR